MSDVLLRTYRDYKGYTTPVLKPKHAARFEAEFWLPLECRPEMAVLEVGCGTGLFLAYLASKGVGDFLGIDLDPALSGFIPPGVASRFRAVDVWDFLREEGPSGRFDRIALFDVLEHFPHADGLRLLAELRRLLRPGGRILIKVPNAASPWGAQFQHGDLTHRAAYTPLSLRQLSIAAGYRWLGARPHLMGSPARRILDRVLHAVLDQMLMSPPELWSANFFGIIERETGERETGERGE